MMNLKNWHVPCWLELAETKGPCPIGCNYLLRLLIKSRYVYEKKSRESSAEKSHTC
jgi:hypothetical protein